MAQQKLTKNQYLTWVQECSGVVCNTIEGLGDGLAYRKMLAKMYPAAIDALPNTFDSSSASANNWKHIEKCFRDLNVQGFNEISTNALLAMKTEANSEFIQWFHSTFNTRMRAVKCLEAAKLLRNSKIADADESVKSYEDEARKEKELHQEREASQNEELSTRKLFNVEEIKAKEAEDAIKVAVDIAGSIKDILEESLNQEVQEAAVTTNAELYGDESWEKPNTKGNKEDPILAVWQETLTAREYAISALRALAKQHELAVKTATAAKRKLEEYTAAAKEQSIKSEKLRRVAEYKRGEAEKASEAVKQAKFAIAVIDAYENADPKVQERVHKDAVHALRRVEDCLDAFDVVKHTSSNLRAYSGTYVD